MPGGKSLRFAFPTVSPAVRGTPRDVMVAESVPHAGLGSAYGFIQAMDSAGAIAGPLIALSLLPLFGMRGVFWFAALPGGLCILAAALGIRETKIQPVAEPKAKPQVTIGWRDFPKGFYAVLFAVALFAGILVLRRKMWIRTNPLLGLVFNIVYVSPWPAGRLSDRVSGVHAASGYLVLPLLFCFCSGSVAPCDLDCNGIKVVYAY